MGKKSGHSWLEAVKKAFRSPTNHDRRSSKAREEENEPEEEEKRGKKRWSFRRHLPVETTIQHNVAGEESTVARKQPKMENPSSEHRRVFEVAMATAAAAEAAVATAVEIIRFTRPSLLAKQDQAAVVVQKIFRGYLARRALMALKGVVKLQALIRGYNVRKQAKMTLQCIQSLVRVQALVCDRRRRLSCEAATLATMFSHDSTVRNSISRNMSRISSSLDVDSQISVSDGQRWFRKDRNLCKIEVDTFTPAYINVSLQSPRTPSSSKSNRAGETPPLPRPNYMSATASAIARVRLSSTPRQRLSSPSREQPTGSAKKRLSFPVHAD